MCDGSHLVPTRRADLGLLKRVSSARGSAFSPPVRGWVGEDYLYNRRRGPAAQVVGLGERLCCIGEDFAWDVIMMFFLRKVVTLPSMTS